VVEALQKLEAGGKLDIEKNILLWRDIKGLDSCVGLIHLAGNAGEDLKLAESNIGQQLVAEGLISRDRLGLIDSVTKLSLGNIKIPAALLKDSQGWKILEEYAELAVSGDNSKNLDLAKCLENYERPLLKSPLIRSQFEEVLKEEGAEFGNLKIRTRLISFYNTLVRQGLLVDQPVEIARLASKLGKAKINLNQAESLVADPPVMIFSDHNTVPTTAEEALGFLTNLGKLQVHGTQGILRLFDNAWREKNSIRGFYSEAQVANFLIERGLKVVEVSKQGPKSGHIDYDILVHGPKGYLGIEVKSTLEALYQKNYLQEHRGIIATQIYHFTNHAKQDQYRPVVIVLDSSGRFLLPEIRKVWQELEKEFSSNEVPLLLDKDTRPIAWD